VQSKYHCSYKIIPLCVLHVKCKKLTHTALSVRVRMFQLKFTCYVRFAVSVICQLYLLWYMLFKSNVTLFSKTTGHADCRQIDYKNSTYIAVRSITLKHVSM
jgi:hypothetical protein